MQESCREHFVSKGMCCDFAIHDPDPPGHNPHCHVMLTMRAIDENGKWLPKSRKEDIQDQLYESDFDRFLMLEQSAENSVMENKLLLTTAAQNMNGLLRLFWQRGWYQIMIPTSWWLYRLSKKLRCYLWCWVDAICAGTVCTNRWLTTVSPQTSVEATETALRESSGNDVVRNKND